MSFLLLQDGFYSVGLVTLYLVLVPLVFLFVHPLELTSLF